MYREAADRNAVLFQVGLPDRTAEDLPDRQAALQEITSILAAVGITMGESMDLAGIPAAVRARLAPHLAELNRLPRPPFRPVAGLQEQMTACQAASLLTISDEGREPRFVVHRWTATELARRAARQPDKRLAEAHRRAAAYWLWRVRVWPQDEATDVHDLLEGRHHLLEAGYTKEAGRITETICAQFHTWGAWDQETALIHDTLARLPADSPRRAAWIHQLGILAQDRGDYDEAARQQQRALAVKEQLGDQAAVARSYHQLGIAAQKRGDYDEAARQYQRALDIFERLGDQLGIARGYHQLGIIAHLHGDYDEAERQCQHALGFFERLGDQASMALGYYRLGVTARARGNYEEATRQHQRAVGITEQLGDQAGMALSYHELGILAHDSGDYDEAERQYQRSLDIEERIGDQVGMALSHHRLGILAHDRGDYDEAASQYQRSLGIKERLGDQTGMASSYSKLAFLEADRGGPASAIIAWHVKALATRLRLGIQQAVIDLHQLAAYRRKLGAEPFMGMLTRAADDMNLAETITSLLDQVDAADDDTA